MKTLYLVKETQKNEQTGETYAYCLVPGGYVHEWEGDHYAGECYDKAHAVARMKRASALNEKGFISTFEIVEFNPEKAKREREEKQLTKLEKDNAEKLAELKRLYIRDMLLCKLRHEAKHEGADADTIAEILAMVEEVSEKQRYIMQDIRQNNAIIEKLKGGAF